MVAIAGVVSSHDPQGKGIPKGVTYVTAKDKGFGMITFGPCLHVY
jgi:hypothetical protein